MYIQYLQDLYYRVIFFIEFMIERDTTPLMSYDSRS